MFAALLRSLGFAVSMLSAEVARGRGQFSPPFDLMALVVQLEERWLADVGFGESFLEPLLLDTETEQLQGDQGFKIVSDGLYRVLLRRVGDESEVGDEWEEKYRFTLEPHEYADYEEMCRFHQTSPQSHFTKNRICSRATPDGRITLSGMRYIVTTKDGRQERLLDSANEYKEVLRDQFGVDI